MNQVFDQRHNSNKSTHETMESVTEITDVLPQHSQEENNT